MTAIKIKTKAELKIMQQAGSIAGEVLQRLRTELRPGITTGKLDALAEQLILDRGGKPAFKGYRGFPASICTSVNEQVVHGIPGDRVLDEGDIISIDVGVIYDGFYADHAVTLPVGAVDAETQRLLTVTEAALMAGIAAALPGGRLTDIGHAIETVALQAGMGVVRDYVGHGIGREMHEEPAVPNYGPPGRGPQLAPGMALAIEPMLNIGGPEVDLAADRWTVVTRDGSRSAHFEHTVAVTDGEPMILTLPPL